MPRGNDLQRMRSRCATAERRVVTACGRAMVNTLGKMVDRGFTAGRDVNGARFVPPKDGHRPPMVRSGRLRQAIHVSGQASLDGWRVRISEDTDYGQFLRDGTSKMAARQFVPRPGQPLPAPWDAAIQRDISRIVARESAP